MLNYANKMIYFYYCIFDNNFYISSILFKFSIYKLLTDIYSNKVWESKVCINSIQA